MERLIIGALFFVGQGGSKVAMSRGDEVYYLSGDHLGSTSLTTDSNKEIISEVRRMRCRMVKSVGTTALRSRTLALPRSATKLRLA